MSKTLKNLFFVLTILLLTLSIVFAGGVSQKISVVLNNINIELNGVKIKTDVFEYKNVTFISLTKAAEMFGKGTAFNKQTNTVNIYNIRPLPDAEVKGLWKTVDIVQEFYIFNPKVKSFNGEFGIKEMSFRDNGELFVNNVPYPNTLWGDGVVFAGVFKDNQISDKRTANNYTIKTINGEQYMFFEYKTGDYIKSNAKPIMYVLKRDKTAVSTLPKNNPPAAAVSNKIITFSDINLEKLIRKQINKPIGDINETDVQKITSIFSQGDNIKSLEGIQYLINLKDLQLYEQQIEDISPIRDLTKLEFVDFYKNNIKDISCLEKLVNLEHLNLPDNKIKDISAIKGLFKLERLNVGNNEITNINAVTSLKNLTEFYFYGNPITDISPLKNIDTIVNKNRSDGKLYFDKNGCKYFETFYKTAAVKINSKIYLLESSNFNMYIDENNKHYFANVVLDMLLNVGDGSYRISPSPNPYIDGYVEYGVGYTNHMTSKVEFTGVNDSYTYGEYFNKDKSKVYPYRIKIGDDLGINRILKSGYDFLLTPAGEILNYLGIDYKLEFDNSNKIVIFELN